MDRKLIRALAQQAEQPFADPLWEEWAEGEPYRRFLHKLVVALGGPALELGVDNGLTSALMAATRHDVIGVDSRHLITTAPPFRFPNFRFLFCDSLGAAKGVRRILGDRKLRVVFQDSSHHAEPSRLEWEYYSPMLASDGWAWVCDDVTENFKMPDEPLGMLGYFEALPGNKMTFPDLHRGNVIGVVFP